VALTGHFALVADTFGGLRIINVSNPAAPVETGFSNAPEEARSVAVQGEFIYVAGGADGFYVFRLFPGGYVNLWDFWSSPTTLHDVVVSGNYAYLAAGDGGLYVMDISNPAATTLVAALDTTGYGLGLAIAGPFVYLADSYLGLRLIDVSNPAAPLDLGFYDIPGLAMDVAISGGRVLLAAQEWGLYIYSGQQTLSGRVADWYGTPFAGITVTAEATGAALVEAQTDAGGFYSITNTLPGATYSVRPESPEYSFWPAAQTTAAPAAWVNFTLLPTPVSNTVTPEQGGTLLFADTRGLTTSLDFPAGAVTATTTFYLTPTLAAGAGRLIFTGHAFALEPAIQFSVPVTATIWYADHDIGLIEEEEALSLQWWNGNGWQEAAESCDPPSVYGRFIETNQISLPICRAGRFALFGPGYHLNLPIIKW
jgi:hypothetical protein